MSEERMDGMDEMVERVRDVYHVPPETPREAMWGAISAGMAEHATQQEAAKVMDLNEARRQRDLTRHPLSWAVAAAALVVLGIGIGRISAPTTSVESGVAVVDVAPAAIALATQEHLGRTESLLTMVRADARSGALDPATAEWARGLLSQTRLFIDTRPEGDPALTELFEDLELVLVQIVGLAESGSNDSARARTELQLALNSLEDGEVLPRIQAALPTGMAGA